jgi:hypothetical protein
MKLRATLPLFLLLIAALGNASAQNLFTGTWKLDQAKSQLSGDTMTFGQAAGDAIEMNAGGTKYSFRLDGGNYRTAEGDIASWKQVDASTWTAAYSTSDGKPLSTDSLTLSADGKTLTVSSTGTRPNGETFHNTSVYTRTAGTDGLLGSWKSTSVTLSAPNALTISGNGLDGLAIEIPTLKASVRANFDGKDVAPSGPTVPPGLTISLMRIGPASFRLVQKVNGIVAYSSRYTVSDDGKTMTEIGNAPGDPSQTSVWEKQ